MDFSSGLGTSISKEVITCFYKSYKWKLSLSIFRENITKSHNSVYIYKSLFIY